MPRRQHHSGFTLIELMVVIVVIILLAGLLIPVVTMVRGASYGAKTQQNLMNISKAVDAYYMTFNAYPGPLTNLQVWQPTLAAQPFIPYGGIDYRLKGAVYTPGNPIPTISAFKAPGKITMSENLVLGLLGGLSFSTNPPQFLYDPHKVGKGSGNLNPAQQAKAQNSAFMEVKPGDLSDPSALHYADSEGTADDSEIPEFLDAFPNGMPILYLRARVQGGVNPAVAIGNANNAVATDDLNGPRTSQYDVTQVAGYTRALNNQPIGVGKNEDVKRKYKNQITGTKYDWPNHGLQTVDMRGRLTNWNNVAGSQPQYPYELYAYLLHPSIPNTPRQKDGYILISAGKSRIYGTEDDITSFGSVTP